MVIPFFGILAIFICLDLWVWVGFDRMLRRLAHGWLWRWMLAILMVPPMAFILLTLLAFHRMARAHPYIPPLLGAYAYIWHFLILGPTVLGLASCLLVRRLVQAYREVRVRLQRNNADPPAVPMAEPPAPATFPVWSRRGFLTAAAFALPPLASFSLVKVGMAQRGQFRIRRFELAIAGWPAPLDGLTIALVADVHAGIFSTPKMLSDVADATNNLRADLVLLGGDLVNMTHADLPSALDMVMRMEGRYGLYMVEGNHDVIEPARDFEAVCRKRGVRLLVNEVETIAPRGVPIQLLGTRWDVSSPTTTQAAAMAQSVATVACDRDLTLFPILLAHHPHRWDEAAARGIPLVLSGHTHGGQIMLTPTIGAGPLRFKYWSGLYQKPGSSLIVSNGVGNWFPLRVNAPAEILHITLHPVS